VSWSFSINGLQYLYLYLFTLTLLAFRPLPDYKSYPPVVTLKQITFRSFLVVATYIFLVLLHRQLGTHISLHKFIILTVAHFFLSEIRSISVLETMNAGKPHKAPANYITGSPFHTLDVIYDSLSLLLHVTPTFDNFSGNAALDWRLVSRNGVKQHNI